ncbi:MAG: Lactyl (2) diphospho-(5')guanosine:7,8-didemethyl-8-hydroxy-5-deazariboflavin 2-phospho-L-lactate transferase, partial [uncultured Actinomycetospora sp.]
EGHGPGRRRRRRPVPAGRQGRRRPRRRDPRGGQRRRRHLAARAARVPRPRHLHVHARRGHRPGARLGPGEGDLVGARGARGLRRRPDVVRPRRPGRRDAPRAHADAARRLPALAGHRRAVPPLGARGGPDPGQRRPHRDPRRGGHCRRPSSAQGDPLPGVVGAPPRRAARALLRLGRARPGHGLPRRAGRRRRRRRRARGAVEPRGQRPHGRRRARDAARAVRGAGQGRRGVADRRRGARARHGRRLPVGHRRGHQRRGGRPPLRRTRRGRAARRLARLHLRRGGDGPRRRGPRGAADDDRPRHHGGDGACGVRAGRRPRSAAEPDHRWCL